MSGYVASEIMRLLVVLKAAIGKRVLTLILLKIANDWKYNFHPTSTHITEINYVKSKDIFVE